MFFLSRRSILHQLEHYHLQLQIDLIQQQSESNHYLNLSYLSLEHNWDAFHQLSYHPYPQ